MRKHLLSTVFLVFIVLQTTWGYCDSRKPIVVGMLTFPPISFTQAEIDAKANMGVMFDYLEYIFYRYNYKYEFKIYPLNRIKKMLVREQLTLFPCTASVHKKISKNYLKGKLFMNMTPVIITTDLSVKSISAVEGQEILTTLGMKDLLVPLARNKNKIHYTRSQSSMANTLIRGRAKTIAGYVNSLEYFIKNSVYYHPKFKYNIIPIGKQIETFFCYHKNRPNAEKELNNIQTAWSNFPRKFIKRVAKKYDFEIDINRKK